MQSMNAQWTMARRTLKFKDMSAWEVSERRQVGDAEEMMSPSEPKLEARREKKPWWRDVGMEEGV